MPIRPENKARYPENWKEIADRIKRAANWECEGSPLFPWCKAKHGKRHPYTGAIVVITVAHLDHTPENCDPDNLRAWCQRCHNTYDAPNRRQGIKRRQHEARAVADLFE